MGGLRAERVMLGSICVMGFEPKTASSKNVVKRKKELRDKIKETATDLESLKRNCRDKKLFLKVCFYLHSGNNGNSSKPKDLDNLLKIILDVLPEYMDVKKKEQGLGIIKDTSDDLVYEIYAKKEYVSDPQKAGICIELHEFNDSACENAPLSC